MPTFSKKASRTVKSAVKRTKAKTVKSKKSGKTVSSRRQTSALGLSHAKKGFKSAARKSY